VKKPSAPKAIYDAETVRNISVDVYKIRLGQDEVDRMLTKDADDGTKFRERASSYDVLTRAYLDTIATLKSYPLRYFVIPVKREKL
jgi:hypothetical protein